MVQILKPDGTINDRDKLLSLNLTGDLCRRIYRDMVLTRLLDREGRLLGITGRREDKTDKITLWIGPYGQEAAEVASIFAVPKECFAFAYGRDWGVAIARGVPPDAIMHHSFGNVLPEVINEFVSRKVHLYVVVGIHLSHAVGASWANKLTGKVMPPLAYFGDGATSEGFFHEALNWAAIKKVPVIFICENNEWAISTPTNLNKATDTFAERALGYGMDYEYIDGNDPFAVFWATRRAFDRGVKTSKSTLIGAKTYRLGPHTTAAQQIVDIPKEEMAKAIAEDPLPRFQKFLLSEEAEEILGIGWNEEAKRNFELYKRLKDDPAEVAMLYKDTNLALSLEDAGMITELDMMVKAASETARLKFVELFPQGKRLVEETVKWHVTPDVDSRYKELAKQGVSLKKATNVTARNAIGLALFDAMRFDERIVYFGEDVAEAAGVMRLTGLYKDLVPLVAEERFFKERVPDWKNKILHDYLPLKTLFPERIFNSPLDESGIIGAGVGLALNKDAGMRPIMEIQFVGFMWIAMAQFMEQSLMRHRHANLIQMPGVTIIPFGGGELIEYHKENATRPHLNNPGLIVVCPSNPQDSYDMLWASAASENPVIFCSHIGLYRSPKIPELVRRPPSKPIEEFGIRVAREGKDVTVAAYGKLVHECLAVTEELEKEKVSVEVLDLRVISPLKREIIKSSVIKT